MRDLFFQVHLLRDEADKIEEEMAEAEREIQSQERDIGRLRGRLNSMGSRDSLYVRPSKVLSALILLVTRSSSFYDNNTNCNRP